MLLIEKMLLVLLTHHQSLTKNQRQDTLESGNGLSLNCVIFFDKYYYLEFKILLKYI